MAPPKDIARSYPKRGLTADVGFRSEPFFCGDGSFDSTQNAGNAIQFDPDFTFTNGLSVTYWMWHNGENATRYNGFFGQVAFGSISAHTLRFHSKQLGANYDVANVFNARSWHHVCFTLSQDGTAVKCYLDGVEQTLSAQPASALTLPSGSGVADAGIATFQNSASSGSLSMGGHMAKYALYNAVLTEDQVRQIMRAQTFAEVNAIQACQFYFELAANNTDSTGNATTVEDRGTVTYGVTKPQLPRGLDLVRGAAQARCFTGRAVDFDGSTDFLDMGNGVDKNYTTRSDRASFSVWFNADQTSATAFIYQNRTQIATDRPECETQLFTHPSLGLAFDGEGASILIPITAFNVGQWHHFVGIADDTDGPVKAYLDGVLYDSTSIPQAGANGSEFVIGGRSNAPLQIFNGRLSNFKIFNVELTQAQVRELYHNPEMVIPTGASASNLRRHYPLCAFNDTSGMGGRYESDQGVEGVNGEYGGSPVMSFTEPVPCPQLGLQQSATRLYFPNTSTETTVGTLSAAPGTAMSFSLWFNMEDIATNYLFRIGSPVASFGNSINVRLSSSGNSINMFLSGVYSSGLTANFGEWNHVVITTSSSSPYWRCWVNNVEASSPTALPSALNVTATDVAIGSYISGGASGKGIINDVALWHTELDTSDVAALYNSGVQGMDVSTVQSANLKGWWKCDNLTTLKDYSGTGNSIAVNGTFAAASFPENASGSTIVGDFTLKRRGVSVLNKTEDDNDVIAIIPANADVFPTSQGFTCSVWVRGRKTTGNAYIVATTNRSTDQRYSIYTQSGANNWGLEMPVSSSPTTADAAITYDPNEWACLSFTLDFGTNTVKMYTNGALQTTVTRSLAVPTTFSDINVGGSGAAHASITGTTPIALFKTAQRTWSDDEVKRNYYSDLRLIKGLDNE